MNKEERKEADEVLIKFYDKALEMVELLKPLNPKQLNYLKLQYDIAHKKVQLNDLINLESKSE